MAHFGGLPRSPGNNWSPTRPPPPKGTLTPFIPLSLRAFNGEGEEKTEACTCALAQVHASSFGTGGRGEGTPPQIPRGASE